VAVLLLESGGDVLLESGFDLLLETSTTVVVPGGSLCLSVTSPTCVLTVSEDC
jgi:hypothetical protein